MASPSWKKFSLVVTAIGENFFLSNADLKNLSLLAPNFPSYLQPPYHTGQYDQLFFVEENGCSSHITPQDKKSISSPEEGEDVMAQGEKSLTSPEEGEDVVDNADSTSADTIIINQTQFDFELEMDENLNHQDI